MCKKTSLDWTALVLTIIGGLNWGLVGAFNFNLVQSLVGAWPIVARSVYGLVGLAALYTIYFLYKD